MGWWLLRGAFYENITKYVSQQQARPLLNFKLTRYRSWLQSVTGKMKGKPLLDLVGSVIEDYEYLWDNYYFSTATL
jgi:peroxin-16